MSVQALLPELAVKGFFDEERLDFTKGAGALGLQFFAQHFHRAADL